MQGSEGWITRHKMRLWHWGDPGGTFKEGLVGASGGQEMKEETEEKSIA